MSESGFILLEDGTRFPGRVIGGERLEVGEVVFQTGMSGYQEVISDPSYRGQIVTFTSSHIGNTGMNGLDDEAPQPSISGIIVKSLTEVPSSWRSSESLPDYLARHNIPCLSGVDTRALTRHLSRHGAKAGVIARASTSEAEAQKAIQAWPGLVGRDLVSEVTAGREFPNQNREEAWDSWNRATTGSATVASATGGEALPLQGTRLTVIHCGAKEGILDALHERGAEVAVLPSTARHNEILATTPHAVLVSNGPGDPEALEELVSEVRELLGKVPLFGICLGFQVLALALRASTYKMKFGHHGINHPVQDLRTERVWVTSQNHGFAVDPKTLPPEAVETHRSLNDGTCEGFEVPSLGVAALQFHPEAQAGPHDGLPWFDSLNRFRSQFQEIDTASGAVGGDHS
ncbi:MAG: glutamine-hydrolyzing carbamoyl-phosphate synthase small subunit [Candidatus Eisenbacteria bacterium]|uniref:Carbamoyl phosphate synthase small chain n=1 Tax=Eiseniibacteriota bacterium TaxID=2212470 RepID=A0A7Y2E978_UNCEI|nr:glutamine-hydrolyzing carbamoyl-phosphate synthase small subunit [Candidatus Eisenbacteria bacterium]